MSPGRFTVLMLLFDKIAGIPLPQTPAELAEKAGVARATITGLVDTLERDGLVTRRHDSGDRRMMLIHLTPRGQAALEAILPGHFKQMAQQMLPLSESERRTLVRLLSKLAGPTAARRSVCPHACRGGRHLTPTFQPNPHFPWPRKSFLTVAFLLVIVGASCWSRSSRSRR